MKFSSSPLVPAAALSLAACSSAVTSSQLTQIKPGMKPDQVEAILGQPAQIEQSETNDQTLNGEVDRYPGRGGEGRIIYINKTVFKADFITAKKA